MKRVRVITPGKLLQLYFALTHFWKKRNVVLGELFHCEQILKLCLPAQKV